MDFTVDKLVKLRINGIEYVVHKYVAETMDIYNAILDCDDENFLEINWNISPININRALHLVYQCGNQWNEIEDHKDKFEIVSFVRYLGISEQYMKNILEKMFRSVPFDLFIKYCKNALYDEIFVFVLDNYVMSNFKSTRYYKDHNSDLDNLNDSDRIFYLELIDGIKAINFTNEFKTELITKVILTKISASLRSSRQFWIIGSISSEQIASIYTYFGQTTDDFVYTNNKRKYDYGEIIRDGKFVTAIDADEFEMLVANNVAIAILQKKI
jgi:hypothetical protein